MPKKNQLLSNAVSSFARLLLAFRLTSTAQSANAVFAPGNNLALSAIFEVIPEGRMIFRKNLRSRPKPDKSFKPFGNSQSAFRRRYGKWHGGVCNPLNPNFPNC